MNSNEFNNLFETVSEIGKGAYGVAYLVRSLQTGQEAVRKTIRLHGLHKSEKLKTENEVNILSQLDHPNIVKYYSAWEEPDGMSILMEYCPYGDLMQYVKSYEGVPLEPDIILFLFTQICLALKYLHDRKILHRDLKCQNIFVYSFVDIGELHVPIIKIGDFGISKVLEYTQQQAMSGVGTPYYFSPEVCADLPYNNKSDIWSLGCVLYNMCSQKHAFTGRELHPLMQKIIRGVYMPLPTIYRGVIDELVSKCLTQKPENRPGVNALLRLPALMEKLELLWDQEDIDEELAHTVLHNFKLHSYDKKKLHGRISPRFYAMKAVEIPPSVSLGRETEEAQKLKRQQIFTEKISTSLNEANLVQTKTSFRETVYEALHNHDDDNNDFEESLNSKLKLYFGKQPIKDLSEKDRLSRKIEVVTDYVIEKIGKSALISLRGYIDRIKLLPGHNPDEKYVAALLRNNTDLILPVNHLIVCLDLFNKNM